MMDLCLHSLSRSYREVWDIIVIFQFQMLTERMTVEHSKKRHEEPEGWFKIENSCKLV